MYVTNDDIELRLGTARYIQLTDDAGTGSPDPAVADEARLGAEGEADSFLARRYAVPIDTAEHPQTAAVLKSIVLDLIEYRLHARRPPVPSDVSAKGAAAVAYLKRIADGQAHLPSAGPIAANPASGPRAAITGNAKILDADELAEF